MCSRPAPAPPTRPAQWPAPSGVARTRNATPFTSPPPAPYFQLTMGLRPSGTSLKTGLKSPLHHQPHGSYALDQSELGAGAGQSQRQLAGAMLRPYFAQADFATYWFPRGW